MDKQEAILIAEQLLSLKAQIKALKNLSIENGVFTQGQFEKTVDQLEGEIKKEFYDDLKQKGVKIQAE